MEGAQQRRRDDRGQGRRRLSLRHADGPRRGHGHTGVSGPRLGGAQSDGAAASTCGAPRRPPGPQLRWGPAAAGCGLLVVAVCWPRHHARAAAAQDWPPFVLVAGLLLVGLVADGDRLFAAGGHALARLSPNGVLLYAGTAVLVVTVTTLLNLDTSVTFLTPVLVYAARSRGEGEAPLLYGCLLLSNAGSLLLPGSNLTNLIVLGHLHLSGGAFLAHMALPALAAAVVTALVVGAVHHRALRDHRRAAGRAGTPGARRRPRRRRRRHGARGGAAGTGAARWPPSAWWPCCCAGGGTAAARATRAVRRDLARSRASSASPSWSRSSAWPWRSARWGGRGRAPPRCSPTSMPGGRPPWPP